MSSASQDQVVAISVKIPKKLKDDMEKVDVNWSQYIRGCLQNKVDEQKKREAFEKLDEIRRRAKPVTNEEVLSWIREGRL